MVLCALACVGSAGAGTVVGFVPPAISLTAAQTALTYTAYCKGFAFLSGTSARLVIATTEKTALIDTSKPENVSMNNNINVPTTACAITPNFIFVGGPWLDGTTSSIRLGRVAVLPSLGTAYTVSNAFAGGTPLAMHAYDNNAVYVGGDFTSFNGFGSLRRLLFFPSTQTNMNNAVSIGQISSGSVVCIAPAGTSADGIYFGGGFLGNNGSPFSHFGHYRQSNAAVSSMVTFNNTVSAIACNAEFNKVYVGGTFTQANSTAMRLAVITVSAPGTFASVTSVPLPTGFATSNIITALAVAPSGNVYMGTSAAWTNAAGVVINRVARYDIGTGLWSAVGVGVDGACRHLKITDAYTLYIGGDFGTPSTQQCAMVYRDVVPL